MEMDIMVCVVFPDDVNDPTTHELVIRGDHTLTLKTYIEDSHVASVNSASGSVFVGALRDVLSDPRANVVFASGGDLMTEGQN